MISPRNYIRRQTVQTSITKRITLLQLIFAIILSLAVGTASYSLMSKMLARAQHDRILDNVFAASSIVQNCINSNMSLLRQFSDERVFEKYQHTFDSQLLMKHFEQFSHYFDAISYTNPTGMEAFKLDKKQSEAKLLDLSATALFQQSTSDPNRVHLSASAPDILSATMPAIWLGMNMVTYFGEDLGFLSVLVPLDKLDQSLSTIAKKDDIRTLIADGKGIILYDSEQKWRGMQLPGAFSGQDRSLFNNQAPQTMRSAVLDQADCIITGHAIADYGWQVLGLIESKNYTGPYTLFQWKLVIIITLIAVITALLSMLYMKRLLKPVRLLTATARQIASTGNPDQAVEWQSKDDLGNLAHSFNLMLERLHRAQNNLRSEKSTIENIISSIADPLIVTDNYDIIVKANKSLCSLLGCEEKDLLGQDMITLFFPEKNSLVKALEDRSFPGKDLQSVSSIMIDRDKQHVFVSVSGALLKDTNGEIYGKVFIAKDITKLKQAHFRLNHLAWHDSLTELPNRLMLTERLNEMLDMIHRHQRLVAVLFIDLDRFKFVNDTLGHSAGDKVLQIVAERLRTNIRNDDMVARFGGDEFVVLLNDVATINDVKEITEKLLAAIASPINLDGYSYTATVSIGISTAPDQAKNTETLFKYSDLAMYVAKAKGKNDYKIYSPNMHLNSRSVFHMEVAMRQALENDEYTVYFQPIVDTRSRNIIGVEALVRWIRTDGSICPPGDFIPIAEETGLIIPLGHWIMEYSLAKVKQWHDNGYPFISLSMNISERQFRDQNLVNIIQDLVDKTGFPPDKINLELTESILMQDIDRANQTLDKLKQIGLGISIDDFGTGYSSLAHLKRFPIDILKIDQSFVRGLPTNRHDIALTKAIISLAKTLDLTIIAEGVENQIQADYLSLQGVEMLQGFLYSKPVPADVLEELLSKISIMPRKT